MTKELAGLIAKRFIQRRDIKAVQFKNGSWSPDARLEHPEPYNPVGFKMPHLLDHLSGKRTYGHYLLDTDDKCRVFAFDIDLEKDGYFIDLPPYNTLSDEITEAEFDKLIKPIQCNPRELWMGRHNRAARAWFKYQMHMLAHKLCATILDELDIGCAAAYSGSKGIHVYGFTGEMPAKEVREAALLVLDVLDEFEPSRGTNFFRHKNSDPYHGFPNFSLEVYPKQVSLEGKDLGNLLRLPLGKNQKNSKDPTFFLDLTAPLSELAPHRDPVQLLERGNPFL